MIINKNGTSLNNPIEEKLSYAETFKRGIGYYRNLKTHPDLKITKEDLEIFPGVIFEMARREDIPYKQVYDKLVEELNLE